VCLRARACGEGVWGSCGSRWLLEDILSSRVPWLQSLMGATAAVLCSHSALLLWDCGHLLAHRVTRRALYQQRGEAAGLCVCGLQDMRLGGQSRDAQWLLCET